MRVAVTRSGGFAGMVRRAELDSADHPGVRRLIDRIDLDTVPDQPPQPDRFVYDVRVGDRAVRIGEAGLSGDLRDLVDLVLAEGNAPE